MACKENNDCPNYDKKAQHPGCRLNSNDPFPVFEYQLCGYDNEQEAVGVLITAYPNMEKPFRHIEIEECHQDNYKSGEQPEPGRHLQCRSSAFGIGHFTRCIVLYSNFLVS